MYVFNFYPKKSSFFAGIVFTPAILQVSTVITTILILGKKTKIKKINHQLCKTQFNHFFSFTTAKNSS